METASIDEAKAYLYGVAVESFVAERDVLVKTIRAGGDRALANEVKALRKPSAVAAEVNHVVRADPNGVDLILQAAALLRSAQAGALDGTSINASELQQQYRAAIQALAQSAQNRRVEVRAALEAATIDEASNEALRTGCLVVVPTPVSIFGTAPPTDLVEDDASAAQPVDELEERRALKRGDEAAVKKIAAKKAEKKQATAAAKKEAAAKKAEAKQAAEAKAAQIRAAEKKAAEKQAEQKALAAEAERQRKAAAKEAERERKKQLKETQKRHRDALRAHLAALDEEEAASQAVEQATNELDDADREIEAAEHALAELRVRREQTVAERERGEQASADAHVRAEAAQAAVSELADALAALEAQAPS